PSVPTTGSNGSGPTAEAGRGAAPATPAVGAGVGVAGAGSSGPVARHDPGRGQHDVELVVALLDDEALDRAVHLAIARDGGPLVADGVLADQGGDLVGPVLGHLG